MKKTFVFLSALFTIFYLSGFRTRSTPKKKPHLEQAETPEVSKNKYRG